MYFGRARFDGLSSPQSTYHGSDYLSNRCRRRRRHCGLLYRYVSVSQNDNGCSSHRGAIIFQPIPPTETSLWTIIPLRLTSRNNGYFSPHGTLPVSPSKITFVSDLHVYFQRKMIWPILQWPGHNIPVRDFNVNLWNYITGMHGDPIFLPTTWVNDER